MESSVLLLHVLYSHSAYSILICVYATCMIVVLHLFQRPVDVTGATWGGSTVQTDDTTSSVSVPVDLDETLDSLEECSPLKEMLNTVGK